MAPPAPTVENALPEAPAAAAAADAAQISDATPDADQVPDAVPLPPAGTDVHIAADTQTASGAVYTLDGNVKITYRDRALQADHVQYDSDTGDVDMTGHVVVTIGDTQERVQASHGTINLKTQTGRFFDVVGSVGSTRRTTPGEPPATPEEAKAAGMQRYTNGNPFLFTGRMVVKTGPREYAVYGGTITSCQLPNPDWLLSASKFDVDDTHAHSRSSVFHLMGFPVLWMPYVTHPLDANNRQTGILIPEIGINSASKGDTIGEQIYWAINRSTDLTVGTIYYSARGWEQTASLRHRGLGQDFIRSHYSALHDRGYYPGGVFVNQSGTDVTFSARHDLIPADESGDTGTKPIQERAVADVEYLSSFPYREAFSTNFNQAVSSDVESAIYLTREEAGAAVSLEGDRYQGEKRIANTTTKPPQTEEQVHIFHAPSLEFTTTDHMLGATGLEWSMDSSVTALKKTQPGFETSGMVERVDLRPELVYPLHFGGWNLLPSVAGRETFYSRSRFPPSTNPAPGAPPVVENLATLNRAALDLGLDLRPPVLERTFDSGWIRSLLHHDVKHTIEPEIRYRYVTGIDNFPDVLRFDMVDIFSDTNEVEYGVTQRLFLREKADKPCQAAGAGADVMEVLGSAGQPSDAVEEPGEALGRDETAEPVCGNRERITWRVAQKYFFNTNFGGAVTAGPRAILDTTLDFSGISFMTRPRDISPIISRLRIRTSEKTDVEWDFDYDTCSAPSGAVAAALTTGCNRKFTANNLYVDVHQGNVAAGTVIGRLNAPERTYVNGSLSSVANFTQMRVWLSFGRPNKPGFSAATSAGIDLDLGTVQYGAVQTSYNWNCCGLSIEYRKYELGTARNDNGYKFNFTLANIGSAGNLRHQDQIF